MGTSLNNPDISACLDSSTDRAYLRLNVEIDIPRAKYLELAALMDRGLYADAVALVLDLRPDAADYLQLFFAKDLRARSKSTPFPMASRIA